MGQMGQQIWTVTLVMGTNSVQYYHRQKVMEMWTWRRIQKISWVNKISNEEVLQRVSETVTKRHGGKTQRCGQSMC